MNSSILFKEAVERLEANTSRRSSPNESGNSSANGNGSLDLEDACTALVTDAANSASATNAGSA